MATAIEYALMAGASYISTRSDSNKFPAPQGWIENVELRKNDPVSGFEPGRAGKTRHDPASKPQWVKSHSVSG
ncbi:MAG: hypothetical protein PHH47_11700 [Gallionella sp.]|nr:hypothetical protein [Gallionella sp.]MDD4946394.1 hypothetical protein [Gallionella sp.]